MVANLLGTGQALDSSLNTTISEFKLLADAEPVFRSSATQLKLTPHEGVSKIINNYNRMTAFSVADGVDISNAQSLADTSTTYTPGEVAVQTWLPGSTMRRTADPDLQSRTARILMNALMLKEDQDGALQLPSFTPIIGAAGQVLGPGDYYSAVAKLQIGNNRSNPEPPPEPYMIIDHPLKLTTLAGRMMPLSDVPLGTNIYLPATTSRGVTIGPGTNAMTEGLFKQGFKALGMINGATVKQSANIIPDSSDDCSGAAFSKEGLIYVGEVPARLDPDTSDKSFRGAVELNAWMSYAFGLFRASAFGVEILGDATLPVS